jgi:hypothetical protein
MSESRRQKSSGNSPYVLRDDRGPGRQSTIDRHTPTVEQKLLSQIAAHPESGTSL